MHRRAVLQRLSALSLGAGLGGLLHEPEVQAFGAPRSALAPGVPEELRAYNVLEVFLCGGFSQYESVYCVLEHGKNDGTHFHLYGDSPELAAAFETCGYSGPLTEAFAEDALGQLVNFGPFAMPLRQRSDVMDRLRVTIVGHDLAPHEAAIPLALSGRPLGSPGLCGLGSHVQRFFLERDGEGAGPLAYALLSGTLVGLPIDNLRAVVATGMHPAQARPLGIKVDAAGDLGILLERRGVDPVRAEHDALLDFYHAQYRDQLRFGGSGDPLRARPFTDFSAGTRWLSNVDAIAGVLDPSLLVASPGASCGTSAAVDAVSMQLRLATHLLNHAERPARYVCVVDGGLVPVGNGGGGYDSHSDNTSIQARNLTHTLKALLDLVKRPDEDAPNKIDLDRTLIILNTEFGRSPKTEGGTGRNHWPYGYPTVLIGGPVRSRGVAGAIGADGYAVSGSTPQESRIAALLALGIWPFASESFNVADVPAARTEEEAVEMVLANHFGIV